MPSFLWLALCLSGVTSAGGRCNGPGCVSDGPVDGAGQEAPFQRLRPKIPDESVLGDSRSVTRPTQFNFTGWPRLELCMRDWRHLDERDLVPKGSKPTLTFINYPPSNILEPMYFGIYNLSQGGGYVVMRNSATRGRNFSYRIVANFEEPNGMLIENEPGPEPTEMQALLRREARYQHSFTMCPYSARWVNGRLGRCYRTPMWQAMPRHLLRPFIPLAQRKYDLLYMSAFTINELLRPILTEVFPKYKFRWFSPRRPPGFRIPSRDLRKPLGVRLRATAESRMTLVLNALVFEGRETQRLVADFRRRPILSDHGAFAQVSRAARGLPVPYPQLLAIPQMKSRTFEAAMCGSLMLVFDDGENVIEHYYEPGTEFLYWHNSTEFAAIVTDVVANPAKYEPIAWRAYAKTQQLYTTDGWVRLLVDPFVQASRRP